MGAAATTRYVLHTAAYEVEDACNGAVVVLHGDFVITQTTTPASDGGTNVRSRITSTNLEGVDEKGLAYRALDAELSFVHDVPQQTIAPFTDAHATLLLLPQAKRAEDAARFGVQGDRRAERHAIGGARSLVHDLPRPQAHKHLTAARPRPAHALARESHLTGPPPTLYRSVCGTQWRQRRRRERVGSGLLSWFCQERDRQHHEGQDAVSDTCPSAAGA